MKSIFKYLFTVGVLLLAASGPIISQDLSWRIVREGNNQKFKAIFQDKFVQISSENKKYVFQSSDNKYQMHLTTKITQNIYKDSITYEYDTIPSFYQVESGSIAQHQIKISANNVLLQSFFPHYYRNSQKQVELKKKDLVITDSPLVDSKTDPVIIRSLDWVDTSLHDLCLIKSRYNSELRYSKATHWTLQFGFCPSFGLRQLVLSDPQFLEYDARLQRLRNESYTYTYVLNIGLLIGWNSHNFNIQSLFTKQGFKSNNPQRVDWASGLFGAGGNSNEYSYQAAGFSAGYSYRPYRGVVRPFIDVDLYYLRILSSGVNLNNFNDYNRNISGFKVSPGVSFKPLYSVEFRIGPALYYNITYLTRATAINTRFINMGLELNLLLNIPGKKILKDKHQLTDNSSTVVSSASTGSTHVQPSATAEPSGAKNNPDESQVTDKKKQKKHLKSEKKED